VVVNEQNTHTQKGEDENTWDDDQRACKTEKHYEEWEKATDLLDTQR
jgi:hypothetical protein